MECDLVDLQKLAKFNDGYKYLLVTIDTFSKKAIVLPLKSKHGPNVARAMDKVIKKCPKIPKNVMTDKGTEFYNKHVKAVFDKYNINHYSTYTEIKCSIVER